MNNQKLASIDIGLKRIGVATSFIKGVVTPHKAILRKNRNQAAKDVDTFLSQWQIDRLIVGIPSSIQMQKRIKHFVSLLDFNGDIIFIDEDFSSYEAKELIKGDIKQKRDGRIDSLAAKIILERFYEQN